jgi:hypothetical protein
MSERILVYATDWDRLEREAERYRWLRDNCKRTLLMRLPASYAPADVDAAIDEAMRADEATGAT